VVSVIDVPPMGLGDNLEKREVVFVPEIQVWSKGARKCRHTKRNTRIGEIITMTTHLLFQNKSSTSSTNVSEDGLDLCARRRIDAWRESTCCETQGKYLVQLQYLVVSP